VGRLRLDRELRPDPGAGLRRQPIEAVLGVRRVRPGAVRPGATSTDSGLEVSAFRNRDGSRVTKILNAGTTDQPVTLRGAGGGHVSAYVTNESDSVTPVSGPLTVSARSLLTVVTR
jgi:glucosylceramidase